MSHEDHPDGRLRLATLLLAAVAVAAIDSLAALLSLLLGSVATLSFLTLRGKLPIDGLLQRLAVANIFVLWIWLTVAIDWPTLGVSGAGALLAGQITLRVNLLVLGVHGLLSRMNGIALARALVGLGLPPSLGALVALTVRTLRLLGDTQQRLTRAMRARAYVSRVGWRSLQVTGQRVAWLLLHALLRSERLALGWRARGASAWHWPTRRAAPWKSLPKADWLLLLAVVAAMLLALTTDQVLR